MVAELLDELFAFAAAGGRGHALAAARRAYEAATGEILPGEPAFERRIAAFLEWYVLDADAPRQEDLLAQFTTERGATLTAAELAVLAALRRSRLCLLEVRKLARDGAYLTDLLTSDAYVVAQPQGLVGCASKDIVLARLLPFAAETVLTTGMLYVPAAARKQILAIGKTARKVKADAADRQQILLRLAFQINRCERYRHVDPRQFFAEWSTLPLASSRPPPPAQAPLTAHDPHSTVRHEP